MELINYNAAAKRLGLAPQTLRRWISDGNPHALPYFKLGGAVRFDPEQLDEWVRAHAGNAAATFETPEDRAVRHETR